MCYNAFFDENYENLVSSRGGHTGTFTYMCFVPHPPLKMDCHCCFLIFLRYRNWTVSWKIFGTLFSSRFRSIYDLENSPEHVFISAKECVIHRTKCSRTYIELKCCGSSWNWKFADLNRGLKPYIFHLKIPPCKVKLLLEAAGSTRAVFWCPFSGRPVFPLVLLFQVEGDTKHISVKRVIHMTVWSPLREGRRPWFYFSHVGLISS